MRIGVCERAKLREFVFDEGGEGKRKRKRRKEAAAATRVAAGNFVPNQRNRAASLSSVLLLSLPLFFSLSFPCVLLCATIANSRGGVAI